MRIDAALADQLQLRQPLQQWRADLRALADQHQRLGILEPRREGVDVLDVVVMDGDGVAVELAEAIERAQRVEIVVEDGDVHGAFLHTLYLILRSRAAASRRMAAHSAPFAILRDARKCALLRMRSELNTPARIRPCAARSRRSACPCPSRSRSPERRRAAPRCWWSCGLSSASPRRSPSARRPRADRRLRNAARAAGRSLPARRSRSPACWSARGSAQ